MTNRNPAGSRPPRLVISCTEGAGEPLCSGTLLDVFNHYTMQNFWLSGCHTQYVLNVAADKSKLPPPRVQSADQTAGLWSRWETEKGSGGSQILGPTAWDTSLTPIA